VEEDKLYTNCMCKFNHSRENNSKPTRRIVVHFSEKLLRVCMDKGQPWIKKELKYPKYVIYQAKKTGYMVLTLEIMVEKMTIKLEYTKYMCPIGTYLYTACTFLYTNCPDIPLFECNYASKSCREALNGGDAMGIRVSPRAIFFLVVKHPVQAILEHGLGRLVWIWYHG